MKTTISRNRIKGGWEIYPKLSLSLKGNDKECFEIKITNKHKNKLLYVRFD